MAGLHPDSEAELESDSDDEYSGVCEALHPQPLDYDIDTMYEIISKRDDHGWSLDHLRHRWRKLSTSDNTARNQLYRL